MSGEQITTAELSAQLGMRRLMGSSVGFIAPTPVEIVEDEGLEAAVELVCRLLDELVPHFGPELVEKGSNYRRVVAAVAASKIEADWKSGMDSIVTQTSPARAVAAIALVCGAEADTRGKREIAPGLVLSLVNITAHHTYQPAHAQDSTRVTWSGELAQEGPLLEQLLGVKS